MVNQEINQTLVLMKPDALKNSLTGYVLSQLSEFHTGLYFAGTKIVHVNKMLAEEHYAVHRDKPFYPALIDYIMGRIHYPNEPQKQRVIAIIYQGPFAVKKIRKVAGPTDPHTARVETPGSIRSLGTVVPIHKDSIEETGKRMDNLIHASENEAEAEREIKLWFLPHDIPPAMHPYKTQESGEHIYLKKGQISYQYEPGSVCLISPGDKVWESDLSALQLLYQGKEAHCSLQAVAAKYLINEVYGDYLS
ncbi:nucleoside-diphosphate kinase [Fibrobacterota bacterium]